MADTMMIVGTVRYWKKAARLLPQDAGLEFVDYSEVTANKIASIEPDLVLSALVSPEFDALDLAEKLAEAGYQGRYRAITSVLPNPKVVKAEIGSIAPDLDFDIFILDNQGGA